MRVQYMSDVHIEFDEQGHWLNRYAPEGMQDTVLVLAGDVSAGGDTLRVPNMLSQYYRAVVLIAGNHDWYGLDFDQDLTSQLTAQYVVKDNVYLLDNSSVMIEGVMFSGATLWTSFYDGDPRAMMQAKHIMSDYSVVKNMTPDKVYAKHLESVDFLTKAVSFVPTSHVIITHHLPSYNLISLKYRNRGTNAYYASNLDRLIDLAETRHVRAWIFGHTHDTVSEDVGNLKLRCNPFGYIDYELNHSFVNELFIEV